MMIRSGPSQRTFRTQRLLTGLPPLAVFIGFILIWHGFSVFFDIPYYLVPPPLEVLRSIHAHAPELAKATLHTAAASLSGFLLSMIFGVTTAILFSQSKLIERSFFPYAIFLQTVPIVAIAPLIVIWFGSGFQSVVLISFIVSLFPIITNETAGLQRIDPKYLDLFAIYRANRWQILAKLRLPHSVPYLLTGARIASGLAVIGAIIGEFFAGYGTDSYGLGYVIIQTSGQLKTPYLFAAILASTLLGLALFATISAIGNIILRRWRYDPSA